MGLPETTARRKSRSFSLFPQRASNSCALRLESGEFAVFGKESDIIYKLPFGIPRNEILDGAYRSAEKFRQGINVHQSWPLALN